ncbi:MAG: cytochrome c [Verrucomicrobiota bacterium]|jgi:mono/diheme cytochrome c family protein
MRNVYLVTLFVCVLVVSVLGFRGTTFTLPPMDVFPEWAFPGMKHQPKLRPQGDSAFFADGRADRLPPPHVVRSDLPLRDDEHLYLGKLADGSFAPEIPSKIKVDVKFIERGRDRYQIYCLPCHGAAGDGNGMTKRYGMGATPTYHDTRLRTMPDGELFNTISVGKNTMLPYADKLIPEDRWAVIAYVRALQRAQQGTAADVNDAASKKSLGIQ